MKQTKNKNSQSSIVDSKSNRYQPSEIEKKWPPSAKATEGQAKRYDPSSIESKWQKVWEENEIYKFRLDPKKPTYYPLVELPYPSGDLHIGHWFSFATADVHARVHKMMGENVFFTNGYDAFGLPAENAAIKRGIHPQDWTMKNIETMTAQFKTMGSMIDWSHTTAACLPEYYQWNQWIFIRMWEKGLAYRGKMLSNWCPVDQTVLANEHVENGKCWRCGSEVVQKEIEQWFIKLTALADDLIWPNPTETVTLSRHSELVLRYTQDPEPVEWVSESDKKILNRVQDDKLNPTSANVDWPVSVKVAQNQWIGKKEGIEIKYPILPISNNTNTTNVIPAEAGIQKELSVTVFTSRPDTNFGATFIALAPEHPLVEEILEQVQDNKIKKEVREYVDAAARKTELERKEEGKEKSGVFTGAYAINQLTGYKMPIWVSDFVLINFGTGALVGVPGHDERDFEFASKFGLEIKRVVVGKDGDRSPITSIKQVQEENGTMINSDFLDGMDIHKATQKIMDYMEEKGWGKRAVSYHIHDWSISRQRYWGTPVPFVYCVNCMVNLKSQKSNLTYGIDYIEMNKKQYAMIPVSNDELPVTLPYNVDYQPKGKAPLASNEEWMKVKCPKCGQDATRDPETLDTFFDSSWYFWRYLDPHYAKGPFDKLRAIEMMPVDIYFGGAEHTLGHTLYARFFTRFFKMLGLTDLEEFALKRVQHGVILGPDGNRMSKSKGNVINPDDVVKEYGADATRMYLCFMMPYDATAPWDPNGMWGVFRFLKRVWELQYKLRVENGELKNEDLSQKDKVFMNKTIKKVGEDAGSTKFNTAVAEMMKWLNHLESKETISKEEYKNLLLILAPFAPHMSEELFQRINDKGLMISKEESNLSFIPNPSSFVSIHQESWPTVDSAFLVEDTTTIVVQVNGKMRGSLELSTNDINNKEKVILAAKSQENISKHLDGKSAKNIIYVPGKILNFVIS